MRLAKVCVAGLLLAGYLGAQTLPSPREPQFWDGDRLVNIEDSRLVVESPIGPKKTHFLGDGLSAPARSDVFQGAYWVCQPSDRDGEKGMVLLKSQDGSQREIDAWAPAKFAEGPLFGVYPLPRNRYLLVSKRLFVKDKAASFLAVGSKSAKGVIHLDDLIEVDLGDKALEGAARPEFMNDPLRLLYVVGFPLGRMRAGDHIVFAHRTHGRFLILDTATLKTRLVRLFPGIEDKKYWSTGVGGFEHAVLGLQPKRNGQILIASRTEAAVLKAREEEKDFKLHSIGAEHPDVAKQREMVLETLQSKNRKELMGVSRDAGAARFPEVLWWELDPEHGKISPVATPPGAPAHLPRADLIHQFRFRLTPKEAVKFRD